MANCGIDKYDALPARVNFIDVDFVRFRLAQATEVQVKCMEILDRAVKEYESKVEAQSSEAKKK